MTTEFTTQAERRAKQALVTFCSEMRQNNPYGEVDWDNNTWIVGVGRRASARSIERLHFTRHHYVTETTANLGAEFREPFASFVKAVIVWRAINARQRPGAISQMVLVRAFRYVYEELRRSESIRGYSVSPGRLKPFHFSTAAQVVNERESSQSAYRVANYLNYIASLVDRHALTASPLRWKHCISRPETSGGLRQDRIGKDFLQRRDKLLPTDEVLFAVAEISNSADLQTHDAVRQRLTDLLFCGGFRVNENLVLRRDALVEEPVRDDLGHLATNASGDPLPPYLGFRFAPEKHGANVGGIKWIPTDLAPVARRAFKELLELTAEYAKNAEFAYLHPNRVRLGEPWDSMPAKSLLSTRQVSDMLGFPGSKAARAWVNRYLGVPSSRDWRKVCTKADVERGLRDRMGSLEVMVGDEVAPLHEFLAVVPINFFHAGRSCLPGTATLVVDQNISDYLSGRGSGSSRIKSIFERRGSRIESGDPVRINTHQFRHFLDTVASSGGVSDLVRARWMGRKDVSQNSAYDHESGMSIAKKIRLRLVEGGILGPIADAAEKFADLAAREIVADDLVRAVHKTTLGRCFHDWASSPCPEHEACWGCDEHLLIKGSVAEKTEAERQLAEVMSALSVAEAELSDNTYGVNNWVASHSRKRDQLRRILEVHHDPIIPDGTVVHLGREGSALTQDRFSGRCP